MHLIQLTQGYESMVSDEDFLYLMNFKWHIRKLEKLRYAETSGGALPKNRGKVVLMHQLIARRIGWSSMTDHIDGNGLNNQRENLRPCNHQQNMANRSKQSNTASIYKGVFPRTIKYKDSVYKYYVASITINRKQIYLGCYKSELEAAKAYNDYVIQNNLTFYRLNQLTDENTPILT